MRFLIAAIALTAAPAFAQERAPEADIAERLNSPAVQYGVPAAMTAILGALLDTRVGGFAQFTDPDEDIRANDTLGDLVERDDPEFRARAYADARRSTEAMGRMAGSFAAMMPELRATADRLRDQMDRIDRDYDR